MVEIELADERDEAAPRKVSRFLQNQGAAKAAEQPGMTKAGAVTDQWWLTFELASGEIIEMWYDIWTGTSLRGPEDIVTQLACKFEESQSDA